MRPFDEKWKDHRLHDKVESYHSTIAFLNNSVEDDTNDNDLSDSDDDLSDDMSNISQELLPREVSPSAPCVSPVGPFPPSAAGKFHMQFGSVDKEPFSLEVPTSYHLVPKNHLNRIKHKAEKYDNLITTLSRPTYNGTPQADTMLGFASSLVPQCGYAGISTILPILMSTILMNCGIQIDAEKIIASLPSPQYLQTSVTNYAVETAILVRSSIEKNPNVYLSCDKGNKKGNKNLAKFLCWYDVNKKRVRTFLIDVCCVDEDTTDIFQGVYHSIKRFFDADDGNTNADLLKLRGQCTDSGGGGTLYALANKIKEYNMQHNSYLISSCTLHNIQTALRNAVINVLGDGGMEDGEFKLNVMQMLHGCYNIQNYHESDELKEIWKYITKEESTDLKFRKLEEPVLSRWWLVGVCATSFKVCKEVWEKICIAIRNSAPATSACNRIASCTLNLIRKPVIMNDLDLLVGFHNAFIFPHFKFLQRGDPKTGGTPSFLGRHCTVRYYLMMMDIEDIKAEKWLDNIHFKHFRDSLSNLSVEEQEQQKKKLTYFTHYIEQSIIKHFHQWVDRLFFLGLFGDQPMARSFARHIRGNETNSIRGDCNYYSTFHAKTINLLKFDRWVRSNVTFACIMQARSIPIITNHPEAIRLVDIGNDIWADDCGPLLLDLRNNYLHTFAALPTNTQFVERGVKESGYVSLGRRGEENRTILAIARGKDLPDALSSGREQMRREDKDEDGSKRCQLKGKRKTIALMKGIYSHNEEMRRVRDLHSEEEYHSKRRRIKDSLTKPSIQFKKERINRKVDKVKATYFNTPAPNRFQRREGYTLTPLMEGKIQYGKMKKKDNMDAVRDELRVRCISFDSSTGWKEMIKLLKEHERKTNNTVHDKYFRPLTEYDNFRWNEQD